MNQTDEITTTRPRRLPNGRFVRNFSLAVVVAVGGLAACSDDDKSAQEKYCEAGASLESSVNALLNLDVIAEGTNGVESAVNSVEDDVNELRDTATDAAADEVTTLDDALGGLGSALSAAGGDLTAENASAVIDAISAVQTAATGVYSTLTDC